MYVHEYAVAVATTLHDTISNITSYKLARPKGTLAYTTVHTVPPVAFRLHVYRSVSEICEGIGGGAQYILSNFKHIDMQSIFKS